MYISDYRSQITCSFVKFSCSIGIFLNFAPPICRSTDISKCFRGSLRFRDNESQLYFKIQNFVRHEMKPRHDSGSSSIFSALF